MRRFMFFAMIFAGFMLVSCGNEVNTVSDNEGTNDESVNDDETSDEINDETTDEISDETVDETVDEITDETVDESQDEQNDEDTDSGECKNLNVKYDSTGLELIAKDISLAVHSNGWGDLLETLTMETEGSKLLEVPEENPYDGGTPSYFVYETAEGFFTETDYAVFGDTINVDLDPVMSEHLNGAIFMIQYYFGPYTLYDADVKVYKDNSLVGCFKTDGNGRFVIDLPDGDYTFAFKDQDGSYYDEEITEYNENVTVNSNYVELRVPAEAQMEKPNIYLYPEETVYLDITLDFPQGGHVTTSIPEYGTGWNVRVESDGTIDGKYGYLFYESQNPDVFQYRNGWTVENGDLEEFFRINLSAYGFAGREIEDFIEWWIPRLDGGCYNIYPQTAAEIDPVVKLNISIEPDSVQRLSYAVKETSSCVNHLDEPVIEQFVREGFSVLEWGVILR